MTVTLTVTSRNKQSLGASAVKTFHGEGGSIGRGIENAWILPDPTNFVSKVHAVVEVEGGAFYLRDKSTNGTFVNGSEEPIGHGLRVLLTDGDRVRIGEYELVVALTSDLPSYPSTGSRQSPGTLHPGFDAQPPPLPNWDSDRTHGGEDLKPLDIWDRAAPLVPDERQTAEASSRSARQGRVAQQEVSPLNEHFSVPPAVAPPPSAQSGLIPEDWDKPDPDWRGDSATPNWPEPPAPDRPRVPLAQEPLGGSAPAVASSARQERQPPPAAASVPLPSHDQHGQPGVVDPTALKRILEVAGMDAASARSAAVDPELADALGQVLQIFVQGMMDVLRARAEVKATFRLQHTRMQPVENNPLKFCPDGRAALVEFFAKQGTGFLSPVDAVREAFDDTKAHQMAMMAGMEAAFQNLMKRFDPEVLEGEFDKSSGGKAFKALNKAKYWDSLVDLYAKQMRNPDESFKRLFGEPFAEAYETQMARLTAGRKRH